MQALIRISTLSVFALTYLFSAAQPVSEVYRKSLEEVLNNVEKTYNVKIRYSDTQVKDQFVSYATWRFTSDVKQTLDNILKPLDINYRDLGNNVYQLTEYEYYRRPEEEGKKHLDELLSLYSSAKTFDSRKAELRDCITRVLGISLSGVRTPLNPLFRSRKQMKGYTVENVAFESIPGFYVTGTLYRPSGGKGPFPVILCPHGHFYNETDRSIANDSGRYTADMQYRCASLARMGAIVMNYDMYSWGESALQTGGFAFHETSFSPSIQTWNSIRALDFVLSLPDADKSRVGVTGASGGGTQTILLSALDDRVTASAPVVMVSSSFYGGCPCESGLPIHDCGTYKTNNAEIAAMMAPRPQLIVSEICDWTSSVPGTDYPYLKKVYAFYGKESDIENVHLADPHHDYGLTKRRPMYHFFSKTLGLDMRPITDSKGNIDESAVTIQDHLEMLVFGADHKLPANALRSHAEIMKAFALAQGRR
jgi:dienelactone hydrolase